MAPATIKTISHARKQIGMSTSCTTQLRDDLPDGNDLQIKVQKIVETGRGLGSGADRSACLKTGWKYQLQNGNIHTDIAGPRYDWGCGCTMRMWGL
jgi:hypothetical protein